jgi:hypothetical protein
VKHDVTYAAQDGENAVRYAQDCFLKTEVKVKVRVGVEVK